MTARGFQAPFSRIVRRTGAEPGQTASVLPSELRSHRIALGVTDLRRSTSSASCAGGLVGSIAGTWMFRLGHSGVAPVANSGTAVQPPLR
jgi:hypothetical protein